MKLWVDDVRPAPEGYFWTKTVRETITAIREAEGAGFKITEISLDHDAGDYGLPDYIRVLDWLEETGRNYPIQIHSMNVVGRMNMEAICKRNGWEEVK